MEIMVKPITMEDEDRWDALVRDELSAGSRKRSAYSEANTLIDIATMSYSELKRTALENILRLEKCNSLTRHNHYQDLLNAIESTFVPSTAVASSANANLKAFDSPSCASTTRPPTSNNSSKRTMTTSSRQW